MNRKPILIVPGEPNSVFFEIFFKSLFFEKIKSPIILIGSQKILELHMQKLNYKLKINSLDRSKLLIEKLNNTKINLINIDCKLPIKFGKI